MIQAVVFDFDGTVFDSESHVYETVREIFAEHGAELPLEVWGECVGREASFFDPLAYLEERIGRPVDRVALSARRGERFRERIAGQGPLPGVADALDAARELGLRVGLASSSPRAWVEPQLRALGLLERFHAIRVADDVARVKPDPALYTSVLAALGVAPERAVAIEDSPNGALAARRAGMRVVVVPNSVTVHLEFGEAALRLASLAEIPLHDLIRRLAREP